MVKKKETEQIPVETQVSQLTTIVQAQGSKNRDRHNVVMAGTLQACICLWLHNQ